ncbi:MAG TPA: N-6 DNA methylase [Terriglobia bacterium]|nr:N-6 DNA methylase [Terriglobia bacterium]
MLEAIDGVEIDERLFAKLLQHSTRSDGSLKPEAQVRVSWIVRFIREYGYSSKQIDIEVPAGRIGRAADSGSDTVFADIVIYRDNAHKEPFCVMETKAPGQKKGIGQAESYARNLGAEYHAWHDGKNPRRFFRTERFGQQSQAVGDIPHWVGTKPIVAEISKNTELPPFRDENQMREVVHLCHELILEKQGHDPAKAFDELTKLLFLKLYDEKEVPSFYKFMVFATDNQKTVALRLRQLFSEAISSSRYKDIFESKFNPRVNVALELDDLTIYEIVKLLQGYSLVNTVGSIDGADIKGTVFEQMVGNTFRGELAQFFTPRELVGCVVGMIPPSDSQTVLDPSCGSGGFLVMAIRSVSNRVKTEHPNLKPTQIQDKINYFAGSRLFGCDINDRMARVAKMNMIMHGDGHAGIVNEDGLSLRKKMPTQWTDKIEGGQFDIIYSNPPFAGREKDSEILGDFTLGRNIQNDPRSVSKEVIFIEMIANLLRKGGRAGLVLPSGVFNNPSMTRLRDYIRKHTRIVALVGLPHLAFQISGANNEGHLLFIEKVEKVPDDYPIFIDWAVEIGIDSVGRKTGRNDLLGVVKRFESPPKENVIRFSQLKERIDPWYYHPNYTRIVKRLKESGYTWYKLSDIFSISPELFNPKGILENEVLRYIEKGDVDIERGEILASSEQTAKTIPNRATFILRENDILFPNIYDSMRGGAIVPRQFDGYVCTNRFFVLRYNPQRILLEFVMHFFTKPEILVLLKRECSGEINPGITKPAFFSLEVPLPERDEQENILNGVHDIQRDKERLCSEIARLDQRIEEKTRASVPRTITNYDDIKIRRAEFIGDICLIDRGPETKSGKLPF